MRGNRAGVIIVIMRRKKGGVVDGQTARVTSVLVGDELLRELILGRLREGAVGAIELACELDQDPRDVIRVLQELEQEERVVQVPLGTGWGVVE